MGAGKKLLVVELLEFHPAPVYGIQGLVGKGVGSGGFGFGEFHGFKNQACVGIDDKVSNGGDEKAFEAFGTDKKTDIKTAP